MAQFRPATPVRPGGVGEAMPIVFESRTAMHYGAAAIPPSNSTLPPSEREEPRAEPPQSSPWMPQSSIGQPQTTRRLPPYSEATKEVTFHDTLAPYICEFVGTFMLAFIVAICGHTVSKQWLPTSIGCSLIVILYAVGFVSGGHLNPAVSVAFFLARKMPACKCLCYIIVQLSAGILGGLLNELTFGTTSGVMPVRPFDFAQAAIVETVFTTMLCFVFLNVVASSRNNPENDKNQFFALAIGFAMMAAGYSSSRISGVAVNPSISFGLDVSSGDVYYGVLYALFEFMGAAIAALLFRMCRVEDYSQHYSAVGSFSLVEDLATYVPSFGVRLFSEFVGTFFIVLTFGLNTIMLTGATAWAVAAAVACMVYALGNVSGGHFNPAITVAVWLSGRSKCSRKDAGCYALVQCLGGIVAGALMNYIHYHGPTQRKHFDLVGLSSEYHWGTVMTMEIVFTFLLAYVVLAVATSEEYTVSTTRSRQNFYFALAIGFAMGVGIFAAGPVSGGYVNPAVALGFAWEALPTFTTDAGVKGWPVWIDYILKGGSIMCKFIGYFGNCMLYFIYELIGAVLAAGVFRFTHPAEYQKKPPALITYMEYPVKEQYS